MHQRIFGFPPVRTVQCKLSTSRQHTGMVAQRQWLNLQGIPAAHRPENTMLNKGDSSMLLSTPNGRGIARTIVVASNMSHLTYKIGLRLYMTG